MMKGIFLFITLSCPRKPCPATVVSGDIMEKGQLLGFASVALHPDDHIHILV